MNARLISTLLIASISLAGAACGGSEDDDKIPMTADAGNTSHDGGGGQDASVVPPIDIGSDAGPGHTDAWTPVVPITEESSIVWMHTAKEFYRGDLAETPFTYEYVGTIECPEHETKTGSALTSVTDVAVNAEGALYGITSKAAMPLSVEGKVIRCTDVWALPEGSKALMGLTFAPAGTLDQNKEVLVGADNGGSLWRIDETTGKVTQLGTFGTVPANDGHGHAYAEKYVGKNFGLSGDIVFMSNDDSPVGFATVRECSDAKTCSVDTLVEIDLSKLRDNNTGSVVKSIRGQVVKSSDCSDTENSGYGSMYGIAAWSAQVYGFSYKGEIVEISNLDGSACLIAKGKNSSGDPMKFYGAGISTAVEVEINFN